MLHLRRQFSLNLIRRNSNSTLEYLKRKIDSDSVSVRYAQAMDKFHDKILFNSVLEVQTVRLNKLDAITRRKDKWKKAVMEQHVQTLPLVLSQLCEPAKTEDNLEELEEEKSENIPLSSNFPYARYLRVDPSYEIEESAKKDRKIPSNWLQDYEFYDEAEEEMTSTYGTPNPKIPVSNVPCGGCGALLHCKDPGIPGYIPAELFRPLKREQLAKIHCQRCHFLINYDTAINVTVKPEDYIEIISKIKDEFALAVIMVDLLDFPCSIFNNLAEILGPKRSIVLVGNKADLIPRDHPNYLNHIKSCLTEEAVRLGFERRFIKHVALISAKTGYGVEELITSLHNVWRTKGNVYLIGCTNVGKSSLFNALLESDYCKTDVIDLVQKATTCPWPGTTLKMLKFPILRPSDYRLWLRSQRLIKLRKLKADEELARRQEAMKTKKSKYATLIGHIGKTFADDYKIMNSEENLDLISQNQNSGFSGKIFTLDDKSEKYADSKWCFDTPGVIQKDQILHLLTTDEILKTLPHEMMKARAFLMKPNLSLFIAGLGRLDYMEGLERIRVIVFSSLQLPVTLIETQHADEFYSEFLGSEVLAVPMHESDERIKSWPNLEAGDEFTVRGIEKHITVCDVVLSSAGWVGINLPNGKEATFKAWTPQKRGIYVRQPSLLPYGIQLKGTRIQGSLAYHVGDSFTYKRVQKMNRENKYPTFQL